MQIACHEITMTNLYERSRYPDQRSLQGLNIIFHNQKLKGTSLLSFNSYWEFLKFWQDQSITLKLHISMELTPECGQTITQSYILKQTCKCIGILAYLWNMVKTRSSSFHAPHHLQDTSPTTFLLLRFCGQG